MSSRTATESFCFVHTTQYIYEEDNKSALEHLGWQSTFKFRALWSVRDGKGLKWYFSCPNWPYVPLKITTIVLKFILKLNVNTLSYIRLLIMNSSTNWNKELVKKYELLSKICCTTKVKLWSLCSVVSIANRLKAGWSGVRIMASEIGFSLLQMSIPAVGSTQPPIQRVPGFLSPELNNESWSYASAPHTRLSVIHRDNFTDRL